MKATKLLATAKRRTAALGGQAIIPINLALSSELRRDGQHHERIVKDSGGIIAQEA